MPLSPDDRAAIAVTFEGAMPTIEALFHAYCARIAAPERFAIGLYDAGEGDGELLGRQIAQHDIRTADWGERDFGETARAKFRAALRTGRDSGDLVRRNKELFQEGDAPFPGACLAEVGGKRICVATSGLRGTEDEPFALLVIQLMQRLTPSS